MKLTGFTKKKLIALCTAVFGFAIFGLFRLLANVEIGKLPYTDVAESWGAGEAYTLVSVYFTPSAFASDEKLRYLHYEIEDKLKKESIEVDSESGSARLTASTFFAHGSLNVSSPSVKSTTLNALGVWGDFFKIHDQELISGDYFSDKDLNSDYCILDEDAAWKLYGSNDIAGKYLYVGDTPLVIRGVFKQPSDKLSTKAGATGGFCYVSYDYLKENGTCHDISCYEIVMPNPVPGYAAEKVTTQLGMSEDETEIVENTGRFKWLNSLKALQGISTHAMRTKPVVYPWWENVTRVREEKISVLTLISVLGIIYGCTVILVVLVIWFIQNKDIIAYNIVLLYERVRDSFYRKLQKKRGEL